MTWIKKAPTGLIIAVVVTVGVMTVAYLGGYVYLLAMEKDVAEYRALLNTTMNFVMLLLGGTGTVAAVSAARSASNAEDNSNGSLTERDEKIAQLEQQLQVHRKVARTVDPRVTDVGPGA